MSDSALPGGAGTDLHADEQAHFMATMGLEYRIENGNCRGRARVGDYLSVAPGWPSAAVLLTFADVLIGLLASHQTAPRISVTSSLSVHLAGPDSQDGELALDGRITKLGRSMTVGETTVKAARTGQVLATSVGTFLASPRPQDVAPRTLDRFRGPRTVTSTAATLADHVGLRVLEPGIAEIEMRPDLTNATEALQGGLVALLGELAAQSAASALLGSTAVVDSLEVHYLAAARVGPFRAEAEVLSPSLVRVKARDPGRDGRLVSEMVARTRPADGGF